MLQINLRSTIDAHVGRACVLHVRQLISGESRAEPPGSPQSPDRVSERRAATAATPYNGVPYVNQQPGRGICTSLRTIPPGPLSQNGGPNGGPQPKHAYTMQHDKSPLGLGGVVVVGCWRVRAHAARLLGPAHGVCAELCESCASI